MRLPDRFRVALAQLSGSSEPWPPASVTAAETQFQVTLRHTRRALADASALRARVEAQQPPAPDQVAGLRRLEDQLRLTETDLERRLDDLRARSTELERTRYAAQTQALVAELSRNATAAAKLAERAVRDLSQRVATAEAEVQLGDQRIR